MGLTKKVNEGLENRLNENCLHPLTEYFKHQLTFLVSPNLSGNKTEKIQLELTVANQTSPYIAVITADNNAALRKEIIGSYNNASVLAGK